MLLFSFGDWIHISNTYIIDVCVFSNYHLHKANDKIKVNETETSRFWSHFKSFIGPHPAIDEHERNPSQPWHLPIGVSGDDARYTLAGRKIIIMMISSVLQQIESVLSLSVLKICMVCFFLCVLDVLILQIIIIFILFKTRSWHLQISVLSPTIWSLLGHQKLEPSSENCCVEPKCP